MDKSKKYFALSIETGKHKFDHRAVLAPLTYPLVAPVFLIDVSRRQHCGNADLKELLPGSRQLQTAASHQGETPESIPALFLPIANEANVSGRRILQRFIRGNSWNSIDRNWKHDYF
jgi:hypothetical protein